MAKSSCISHPKRQQLVVIRQDYLAIADNNHCAAALLNIFEYWTDIKLGQQEQAETENQIAIAGGADPVDDSLWIYKTIPDLQDELMGLFGETKIATALELLKGKGFIESRNNPKYGWDRTLQYLFNVDAVQAVISRLGSLKSTTSKTAKVRHGSRKNKVAIPKTTTQTPSKTTKEIAPAGANPTTKPSKKLPYPENLKSWTWKHLEQYAEENPTIQTLSGLMGMGMLLKQLPTAYVAQDAVEVFRELNRLQVPPERWQSICDSAEKIKNGASIFKRMMWVIPDWLKANGRVIQIASPQPPSDGEYVRPLSPAQLREKTERERQVS